MIKVDNRSPFLLERERHLPPAATFIVGYDGSSLIGKREPCKLAVRSSRDASLSILHKKQKADGENVQGNTVLFVVN